MDIEIVFLGTSCAVPTKERNHQGILIRYKNEGILLDCGEGIQRQLKIAGINPNVITKILITHWHGDHVFGIPGLLQSMAMSERTDKVKVYGPKGSKKKFEMLKLVYDFHAKEVYEFIDVDKEGTFFENDEFVLVSRQMEHGVPCNGYAFIEKDKIKVDSNKAKKLGIPNGPLIGKLQNREDITYDGKVIKPIDIGELKLGRKISYVTDTSICNSCFELAEDSDLLICESSYTSTLEGKAEEYSHMTAKQAAMLANKANVKKLVLTHFSQRYKTTEDILEEAKTYFHNVVCAYDFMKIKQ